MKKVANIIHLQLMFQKQVTMTLRLNITMYTQINKNNTRCVNSAEKRCFCLEYCKKKQV